MGVGLDRDALDVELLDDGGEFTQLFTARDCDQLETLAFVAQDVEGLYPDGTRRPKERHALSREGHR